MRLFYLLPLAAAVPVLFPARGHSFDRPDMIAGLPEWFFGLALGMAKWQWLALALLLALSAPFSNLVRGLLQRLVATRYRYLRVLHESDSGVRIEHAASLLIASIVWFVIVPWLELPPRLTASLQLLIHTFSIVGVVWLAYGIWDAICDGLESRTNGASTRTQKLLVPITRKLVQALIFIGGALLALASFGVNVTGVIAGLGVGGLLIALAAKDSVENIFGSFTILFDMPFAIGDWVKIGTVEGSVEEINLRSTRIRTSEDSVITLPNSNLIRASVENLGARRHHRVKTTFSVSAQLPADRIAALVERIREVIKSHPKTRKSGFQVEVFEFTFAEVQILVNFFINAASYSEELKHRGDLLMQFKRAAEEMGIESLSAPAPAEKPDEAVPITAEEEATPSEGKEVL